MFFFVFVTGFAIHCVVSLHIQNIKIDFEDVRWSLTRPYGGRSVQMSDAVRTSDMMKVALIGHSESRIFRKVSRAKKKTKTFRQDIFYWSLKGGRSVM